MIKKIVVGFICFMMIAILGACGDDEKISEETSGEASGITLAGEKALEIKGIVNSIATNEEIMIAVDGKEIIYRLSEEAKNQIEAKEVEIDDKVTFTTFSIGDEQEMIAEFIIK